MMLIVRQSPNNLRAYGADDERLPALWILFSVCVTLPDRYWVTSDERRRSDVFLVHQKTRGHWRDE